MAIGARSATQNSPNHCNKSNDTRMGECRKRESRYFISPRSRRLDESRLDSSLGVGIWVLSPDIPSAGSFKKRKGSQCLYWTKNNLRLAHTVNESDRISQLGSSPSVFTASTFLHVSLILRVPQPGHLSTIAASLIGPK